MLSAKNRIIKTSRRDFKVNKLLFVITNLVLFMNFIMQMSIRKFITHYIESETNYYEGYAIAYVCIAAIALCAVFTVFTLFRELFSQTPRRPCVFSPSRCKRTLLLKASHSAEAAYPACDILEHHSVYRHTPHNGYHTEHVGKIFRRIYVLTAFHKPFCDTCGAFVHDMLRQACRNALHSGDNNSLRGCSPCLHTLLHH